MTEAEIKQNRRRRRKKQRKKSLITTLIILLCLALMVGAVLCLTVLFPIEQVTATGSALYAPQQIVQASGLDEKDNIFTFSSSAAATRIRKILPYVDSLKIERRLPGTVKLTVTDAVEYAVFPQDNQYFVISEKGHVLNVYTQAPDLLTIYCDAAVCKVGQDVSYTDDSAAEAVEILIGKTTACGLALNMIDVNDSANITALVEGRFTVEFGTQNNLAKKIDHLAGMVQSMEKDRTGTINLKMWSKDSPEGTFRADTTS